MSKLERLLNLIAALLHTSGPLLIEQVRTQVEGYPAGEEAFKRAFERDKDELRSMGIPIRTEPVRGTDPVREGYRIDPGDYAGTDARLAPDELAALHLAATLVRLDGVDGEDALRRLGGLPGDRPDVGPVAALPTPAGLGALFAAARDRRQVSFTYRGDRRRLEPWTVTFTRGRWYTSGHDCVRGATRRFRVDRIESSVIDEGAATGPAPEGEDAGGVRLAPWRMGDDEPVTATVLIDADQAAWAIHQVEPATIVEHRDDGALVIRLEVTNRDAFRSFVLTFLEHAEVLDPPELRDELVGWLQAMLP